jgi:hypothetical protein
LNKESGEWRMIAIQNHRFGEHVHRYITKELLRQLLKLLEKYNVAVYQVTGRLLRLL